MEHLGSLEIIVNFMANHWQVLRWYFLGLSVKYIGDGIFSVIKAIIILYMGYKEVRK